CPWCYIGKRRLEAALATFEHAAEVEVIWRSFELDPSTPKVLDPSVSLAERLARKYRVSVAQAGAMMQRVTDTAAADGIEMRFDRAKPGNTFDGHRMIHLAKAQGLGGAMKERLLRAYFTEGRSVADADTLVSLAAEVGLEPDEARAVLATDAHADDVRRDEAEAVALGIQGVPCFVLAERFAVSGAQPPETMRHVLDRAWAEVGPAAFEDGALCGPDGC
ncbi:MAG: DsbA family oxidoreductase, partial [Myxococcales bacterium]|nr:DsbA family oxidoreductase [Myxococcales bacterium]